MRSAEHDSKILYYNQSTGNSNEKLTAFSLGITILKNGKKNI